MAKKDDFEDDNRTIADMSGVERPALFGHIPGGRLADRVKKEDAQNTRRSDEVPGGGSFDLTPQEKRWYILGVIKSSLLIGLCFAAGLGLIIFLMVMFW